MFRYALLLALVVGTVASATPVPKSIKRKKADSPDGTWRLVEFWSNGKQGTAQGMTPVWTLEGESFYVGPKQEGNLWQLTIPDPEQPNLRRFAHGRNVLAPYNAAVEVDGDTLKFCYASDTKVAVTECSPHQNVHYYVFTRVVESGPAADGGPVAVDDLPRKR